MRVCVCVCPPPVRRNNNNNNNKQACLLYAEKCGLQFETEDINAFTDQAEISAFRAVLQEMIHDIMQLFPPTTTPLPSPRSIGPLLSSVVGTGESPPSVVVVGAAAAAAAGAASPLVVSSPNGARVVPMTVARAVGGGQ